MFAFSPAHILLIIGIAVLVFGPKFLEDAVSNLKGGVSGFQKSFKDGQAEEHKAE